MQYSVVRYSEIKDEIDTFSFRIDADFFKPEYLSINEQVSNYSELGKIALLRDLQSNGAFKQIFSILNDDNIKIIPYIRSSNVGGFFLNNDNLEFISKEAHSKLFKTHTKIDDILMARKGRIGGATIINKDSINFNSNDNVVNIRLKDNNFIAEYVTTYLNSKYGYKQVERLATGNVQPWLSMHQVRILKIAQPTLYFQKNIKSLIKNAYALLDQSKSLYSEAENLLLEELGLKDWKPKHQLSYIKNYSDTQKAERFDAEYFQPQYGEVIEKVKNIQNDDLGNIVKWSKGIEVGSEQYIDEGFDFIRISDFNTKGLSETSKQISKELFLELKDKFSPKKGDILFTKDGTIGLTYLVNQDQDAIISGAFLKLRPKIDIESEYLALVLNSIICKKQIEMMSGGAIIAHLKPSDAMKLQIPILSPKKQKEISFKIIDSKEKDNQSKSLLSIAKQAVEIAIETSEEKASSWIDQELEKLGVELKKE